MADYRIWLIEDDETIAGLLTDYLTKYGFETVTCNDFENIEEEFETVNPHLVLMDINLPKYDGFFWCKKLRQITKNPILFISARNLDYDQIYAMDCGGDDYIVKPFSYDIVIAKINAHLRRCFGEYAIGQNHRMICGDCFLHPDRLELQCKGNRITLSKNELNIFQCLFDAFPGYVKRERLLSTLWDEHCFVEENTLNVNIGRARKRLKELESEFCIKTVRGIGYLFEEKSGEEDGDD